MKGPIDPDAHADPAPSDPNTAPAGDAGWKPAADAAEVHALLCASDLQHAQASGTPAPVRRRATTEHHVRLGNTQLLRRGGQAVAMFTLSDDLPTNLDPEVFGPPARAAYLQRLVVAPEAAASDPLAAVSCVRWAMRLAQARGAEVLRCEANPDLVATRRMFELLGFVQCGEVLTDASGVRRVHLCRSLSPR
jgi:hypothetical protein